MYSFNWQNLFTPLKIHQPLPWRWRWKQVLLRQRFMAVGFASGLLCLPRIHLEMYCGGVKPLTHTVDTKDLTLIFSFMKWLDMGGNAGTPFYLIYNYLLFRPSFLGCTGSKHHPQSSCSYPKTYASVSSELMIRVRCC